MKKKILFIKTNSIKGSIDGIDRLLIEFAKNNQYDKNYKFYYLFNIKCKCSEIISRYATVKIIRFPDPYFKSIIKLGFNFFKSWFFLIKLKPEYVVEISPYHYMLTFLLREKTKRILWYHSINYKQEAKNIYLMIFSFIREKVFFNFHGRNLIIGVHQILKDKLISEGFADNEIIILKNGFPNITKEKRELYLSNITHTNKIKIIGIGRLNKRKGGIDFCQFAKIINHNMLEFSYIGVTKNNNNTLIKEFKKYVKFLGHIDDVNKYLFDSNIAIHFSEEEASSMIIREMMSASLPIIGWDVSTVNDDLKHQANLLVNKGDFTAAKEVLFELVDNIDKRLEIGSRNFLLSKEYTTWDMYKIFIKLLISIKN